MLDVRFREKFQDALAVVISEQERAGLDVLAHGDFHVDEDLAGRAWHHYPLQRWPVSKAIIFNPKKPPRPGFTIRPALCSTKSIRAGAGPCRGQIEHRPLDLSSCGASRRAKTRKPIKFGTCCSQVMALFLDIHTPKYKDKRQIIWDMAEAMNKELLALRDAGCRCIQIEEPTFHFMANTFGKDHDEVKFMVDAFNREVQGLDDVELWIHTCWGNPNMQRVMEETGYANSIEIYLERCRGDVWTLEMKDRNQKDLELFAAYKNNLKKKICIGVVSHRQLQADRPKTSPPKSAKLLNTFPRKNSSFRTTAVSAARAATRNRFYKASAIAQGANIVRRELGLPTTYIPAADPTFQIDVIPGRKVPGRR